MSLCLNGKKLSTAIEDALSIRVQDLREEYDIVPQLATILVGDNPSSRKYVQLKTKAGKRIGINVINYELPKNVSGHKLNNLICHLNERHSIHGILLQHPIPDHLLPYEGNFFDLIDPAKDVDGVTSLNFGKLALRRDDSFKPATPYGIMKMLKYYNINCKGKSVIIIGASPILGKPLSLMFSNEGATTTLCDINSKEEYVKMLIKESDIIVGACGVPGRIKAKWINNTHILIDAGYKNGKGDIEPEAWEKSHSFTPVPNGVGPLTISTLLTQTVKACEKVMTCG